MPSALLTHPNTFFPALAADIDFENDTFRFALTNQANEPDAATSESIVTETTVSLANLSGTDVITISSVSQSGGVASVIAADRSITASGGSIGPFRYVIIYDDTNGVDQIVGWWDYGSDITLADGESLALDFDGTNGIMQVRLAD